ncbi:haemagluttinin motif [Vibrio astriarenae]|nr:haemagluttinin motif [Vibrio sp. C7]
MKFTQRAISHAIALALPGSLLASQNPYDKIQDGVPSISVSSDSLINKVNKNTLDINTNKNDIAENRQELVSLDGRVSTNETNISQNRTNISKNASDISVNRSNISTNTTNINTNKTAISRNASNISTNASNIASNTSKINSNTSRINSLEGRMTSAEANIQTLNNRVDSHDRTLSDHEKRISDNEDAIATGGGGSGGMEVIYDGSGTNSITVPDTYSMWVAHVSYSLDGKATTKILDGGWGTSIGVTHTDTKVASCSGPASGQKPTAYASASIKSNASTSMSWSSSASDSHTVGGGYCTLVTARVDITNFKVTKFEVRY